MEKNFQDNKIEHIYIHIPFCLKKCPYCSFYSENFRKKTFNNFLTYLKKEISLYKYRFNIKPKTIYFGGGTPSLLQSSQINEILSLFDLDNATEITLEANPVTLTKNYVKSLTQTNVNRISLGVQSLIDNELKLLGRLHTSKSIAPIIRNLKELGFYNISLDLMYGLPNQKIEDVILSLKKMIDLNPKHISIYSLTLEQDVPMYEMINMLPTDEVESEMYFSIVSILKSNGYHQYEISNFSQKGYQSKHNTAYWNDKFYLGFGPSAAGYVHDFRYENSSDLQRYFITIENKTLFPNKIKLSEKQKMEEYLFLGLRKSEGILLEDFAHKFGQGNLNLYLNKLKKFVESGYLIKKEGRLYLASQSYFISNEIFTEIL